MPEAAVTRLIATRYDAVRRSECHLSRTARAFRREKRKTPMNLILSRADCRANARAEARVLLGKIDAQLAHA